MDSIQSVPRHLNIAQYSKYAQEVLKTYPQEDILGYKETIGNDGCFSDGDPKSYLYDFFVHHRLNGKEYVDIWHWEFWWRDYGKQPEGYLEEEDRERVEIKKFQDSHWGNKIFIPNAKSEILVPRPLGVMVDANFDKYDNEDLLAALALDGEVATSKLRPNPKYKTPQ